MSVIRIENLSKSFDKNQILKNVSLEVEEGERIVIIGKSGCGKSVFLRSIEQLNPPYDGKIIVCGEEITKKGANLNSIRQRMGMVYQGFHLFEHMSVLENIILAPMHLKNMNRVDAVKKAKQLLEMVGLLDKANLMPEVLSGGQKQRIAICRCLAMEPEIMLFDEPTSALDPTMVGEVLATMRLLAKQGMTMIIVTHEMAFAKEIATRILYFDEQGIYEQGSPDEIFDSPKKSKTKAFIRKLKFFDYHINSKRYDLMELQGRIINFGEKYGMNKKMIGHLELITEELIAEIIQGVYDKSEEIDINLEMCFSDQDKVSEIIISSKGKEYNPFDIKQEELVEHLGISIVQKMAQMYDHKYQEGMNVVKIKL